jgi:hypothetical protein
MVKEMFCNLPEFCVATRLLGKLFMPESGQFFKRDDAVRKSDPGHASCTLDLHEEPYGPNGH